MAHEPPPLAGDRQLRAQASGAAAHGFRHELADAIAAEHLRWWRETNLCRHHRVAPVLCGAEIGQHCITWDECRMSYGAAWLRLAP